MSGLPYPGVLLTEELLSVASRRVAELVAAGLSTDRCDRPAAEAAALAAYRAAGYPPPRRMVWTESPLAEAVAAVAIPRFDRAGRGWVPQRRHRPLGIPLGRDRLWTGLSWDRSFRRKARTSWTDLSRKVSMPEQVPGDARHGDASERLGYDEWSDVPLSTRTTIVGSLRAELADLWDERRWERAESWGPNWPFVLVPGGLCYPRDGLGVVEAIAGREAVGLPVEHLRPVLDVFPLTGTWRPTRAAVVFSDRPVAIARDADGRLHHTTGPAVTYADGFGEYYWHGWAVPAALVEPGWTAERILGEANVETRRCAIERIGWDRFLHEARGTQNGPTVPDPGNPGGELTLFDLPPALYERSAQLLVCRNGTPEPDGSYRFFALTVPRVGSDPVAAAAWTYDLDPHVYRGLLRRA